MNMKFATNKTSIQIIKEELFGGTYFRDLLIYSGVDAKWYRTSWKEFDDL